jgi:hypothetical protein
MYLGRFFEASLVRRLVASAVDEDPRWARILLAEAAEECTHSIWFTDALSARTEVFALPFYLRAARRLAPDRRMSRSAWASSLAGELLIDALNQGTAKDPGCGGPVKQVSVAHARSEALHVRTASHALTRTTPDRTSDALVVTSTLLQVRAIVTPAIPATIVDRHGPPGRLHLRSAETVAGVVESVVRRVSSSLRSVAWARILERAALSISLQALRIHDESRTRPIPGTVS